MLLPDCTQRPDDKIHLGTIIPLSRDTKLPDADAPLNRYTRIPPEEVIEAPPEYSWVYENGQTRSESAAANAQIPVFTPVGGGFVLGKSRGSNLTIKCARLETTRFVPKAEYLNQALADKEIRRYCQNRYFPSVYMVTGIKVAYNTELAASSNKASNCKIEGSVDTSALGVPLNVGLSPEVSRGYNDVSQSMVKEGFILAYQLRRLKLRKDASLKSDKSFNNFALFDDRDKNETNESQSPYTQFWVEEDVDDATHHDT
jgi:hypothetical protein